MALRDGFDVSLDTAYFESHFKVLGLSREQVSRRGKADMDILFSRIYRSVCTQKPRQSDSKHECRFLCSTAQCYPIYIERKEVICRTPY